MTLPFSFRPRLTTDRLGALLVTLAPLIYFLPAVRGRIVLAPDDGIIFNVPLRVAAANILRAGYLPLWNPYIFCGMPLHASAQAGVLFPLNWAYLTLSPPVATNVMVLASYAVAALGAYRYARRAGSSVAGAVATSLIWQWCGFLINQISHVNIVQTAAMLPWILWAVDGYGKTGWRWHGVLLASLVALQAFAGHQQTFAYGLLLTAAYAATIALASRENRINYLRSLVFIAAGVLLAAVQILPTFELLRNSPRSAATYEFFSSFSMPRRFVLTLVAPFLMGGGDGTIFRAPYIGPSFYSEYVIYIGVAGLMLALLAVWLQRDARTRFWAIVAIVCLALALGQYAPLRVYELIYHLPLLSLFRVPARHLMEVNFALAVLAGRGLSAIALRRNNEGTQRQVTIASATVVVGMFLVTCITVTWGRPGDFKLGRLAPVSFLRAPELFLPVAFAALGAWAIWRLVKQRRAATAMLLVIIALDLIVWGQSSGWRVTSPDAKSELWGQPDTVKFLRERAPQGDISRYRILTQDQPFDPGVRVPETLPDRGWTPTLQPDIYMMHGIENAAGYDGFGLERYSRLAGDMKVWGDLADAERTLRGESRELDILNVRYLLTKPLSEASKPSESSTTWPAIPAATQELGGQHFASDDLGLPSIGANYRLSFMPPPVEIDHIALVTNLSWSVEVPNGASVARVRLRVAGGKTLDFELRAGQDTSDWAYDREDINRRIKHQRAPVATSYSVVDGEHTYEGHTYVCSFALPERALVTGGEIFVERLTKAPDLTLGVLRVSFINERDGKTFPLHREWVTKEPMLSPSSLPVTSTTAETAPVPRWRPLTQLGKVAIFENTRVLPRAWLASSVQVLSGDRILDVIRTGKLPDNSVWDPLRTALIESAIDSQERLGEDPSSHVDVITQEPNRIELQTASSAPAVLVLSDNHYPGWHTYVDGHAQETLRVNYNLRGIPIAAGSHRIAFVYQPKSVMIGLFASLLVLSALVLWATHKLSEPGS